MCESIITKGSARPDHGQWVDRYEHAEQHSIIKHTWTKGLPASTTSQSPAGSLVDPQAVHQ